MNIHEEAAQYLKAGGVYRRNKTYFVATPLPDAGSWLLRLITADGTPYMRFESSLFGYVLFPQADEWYMVTVIDPNNMRRVKLDGVSNFIKPAELELVSDNYAAYVQDMALSVLLEDIDPGVWQ